MSVIRWENPPAAMRGGPGVGRVFIAHDLIAHQCKKNPGRWAVIAESAYLSAALPSAITSGKRRAYRPPGSFEAVARVVGGVPTIYVRYVGGEGQ